MKRFLFIAFCMASAIAAVAQESISVSGLWEFAVGDSADYKSEVVLPGMQLEDRQYMGKAWYRKSVYVPHSWTGRHVTLFLEKPHIATSVRVNGQEAGSQDWLFTPHEYDVDKFLVPGQRNTIEICVTDSLHGNRNGIAGMMELRSKAGPYIDKVTVIPYVSFGIVHVELEIGAFPRSVFYQLPDLIIGVERADTESTPVMHFFEVDDRKVSVNVPLGLSASQWNEFTPSLYRLGITFGDDYYETTFGMREISVIDGNLCINKHLAMLRGVVDDNCEEGYFSFDEEDWAQKFKKYKDYGFNCVRFRSYCPPDAAFAVADRLGIYLLPECLSEQVGQQRQIVNTYGHHPSFVMLMACDEHQDSRKAYTCNWEAGAECSVRIVDCCTLPADNVEETHKGKKKEKRIVLANLPGVEVPSDSSSVSPQEDNSENETMRYKQEIECCLRSEGYAGFLIPSLPGRTMAEEWLEFCSPVVSLAEFPKFVYSNTDTLEIHVDAYNAMYAPVSDIKNTYYITDDSMKVVSGGVLSQGDLPVGSNIYIGKVRFPLNGIKTPSRLTLNVLIGGKLKNHWDFQVYPSDAESEEEPKTDTQ